MNGKAQPPRASSSAAASAPPGHQHLRNEYAQDVISAAMTRRAALGSASRRKPSTVGRWPPPPSPRTRRLLGQSGKARLDFTPHQAGEHDGGRSQRPQGLRRSPIIRWGDPRSTTPQFDPKNQTPEAQAEQFGYNSDYLDTTPDPRAQRACW
ncbi:hypothetical protein QJS66_19690 [Kocuria rhizophila]|nr:hypothetical protein QJS66_19690 [Kocuria rhizophila]